MGSKALSEQLGQRDGTLAFSFTSIVTFTNTRGPHIHKQITIAL